MPRPKPVSVIFAWTHEEAHPEWYCPLCQYPLGEVSKCVNPACVADKDDGQIALINKAIAEERKREKWLNEHRSRMDYELSFRRRKGN